MPPDAAQDGPGNSRFWRWTLIAVPVVPALGVGTLLAMGALYHDCGEVQADVTIGLMHVSGSIREIVADTRGEFLTDAEVEAKLGVLDPWERPFRYELLGERGERARVYSLGEDGVPGGVDCDEDQVHWLDLEGGHWTRDLRVIPDAWR